MHAAFSAGASGYVVKMDAGSELPTAVKAVLWSERFVGDRFDKVLPRTRMHDPLGGRRRHKVFQFRQPQNIEIALIGLRSETNATVYFVLTAVQISLLHLIQPSGYDVLRPRTGREHKPWSRLRAAT